MHNILLSILLLQFLEFGAYAQQQFAPRGYLTVNADSTGSYWQVLTDAKSRSTRVQFFGADHAMLYEEAIPEKWIKQNKRNQRRLDELLADISANKLVIARLKTEELPHETAKVREVSHGENRNMNLRENLYQVRVSVSSVGKVRLAVDNPESLRYKIEVADYRDKIVYQEFTTHNRYRRHLDISPVTGETAKLILTIDGQRLVYNIKKQESRSSYTVDPVIASR